MLKWQNVLPFAAAAHGISTGQAHAQMRVATWNIQTLTTGKPVFTDQYTRTAADLAALRAHRETIEADVFALQEIASPAAAAQVFPVDQWTICISGQFFESYPQFGEPAQAKCYAEAPLPDTPPEAPFAKQFTAFAIKKTRAASFAVSDLAALGVMHRDPKDDIERAVRWGLVVTLSWEDKPLTLLNVHLKSGCRSDHSWRMKRDSPQFPNCQTLGEQVRPLADFVRKTPRPFVVLGDFNRRMGPNDMLLMRMTGAHSPKNPNDDVALELRSATDQSVCSIAPRVPQVDHFLLSKGIKGNQLSLHSPSSAATLFGGAPKQALGDHCAISLKIVQEQP